jgi:hypothetical protein
MQRTLFLFSVLWSAAALAACGPKPAAHTTTPDNTGGTPLAAATPYAHLFEEGRSWTYQVKHTSSHWDDQDPKADANGNVNEEEETTATCRVDSMTKGAEGAYSTLACDGLDEGTALASAQWFMDDTGLYVDRGGDDKDLVLAAVPAERHDAQHEDDGDPTEETSFDEIKQDGDKWCWTVAYLQGDESWDTICFAGGDIVSGDFGWSGGSTEETTYEVAK